MNCQSLSALAETFGHRYPGVEVEMSQSISGHLVIHKLAVPLAKRGAGTGSAVMRDVVAEADKRGWPLALTPSIDFGGSSRRRLERFYRRFGFVPNRGRRRDFKTAEAMIRNPEKSKASEEANPASNP